MNPTRREFSAPTKRAAFDRSKRGGDVPVCECYRVPQLNRPEGCGVILRAGSTFYEHVHQDNLGGAPTIDNCAVLSLTCWRQKTDRIDLPTIASANRKRDRNAGIKPNNYLPITGSVRSGIRLPFRGAPVDRRTGLPWKSW